MAYSTTVNFTCANRAAALAELWTRLVAQGWTLHDNQDGSSYRIYSSNGEATDRIPEYIKITWTTANVISFQAYGWWDSATHAGTCNNTGIVSLVTAETGFYLWIYGDMNLVYVMTKVSTIYYSTMFGHVKNRQHSLVTDTTAPATAGSSVSVAVTSSTGFVEGESYQIFGDAGEGRDWVVVEDIADGTHLTITTLPRDYGTGAFIGYCPSTFGVCSTTAFYSTCPQSVVGTAATALAGTIGTDIYAAGAGDPDVRRNAWHLCPMRFTGTTTTEAVGYHEDYILYCDSTGLTCEDTIGVGLLDSGTAEVGGAATLQDTDKAWGINAHANKAVVITLGTGVGQIRKIASNTADTLTVSSNWVTIPAADSQYKIYNEGYRFLVGTLFTVPVVCREGA